MPFTEEELAEMAAADAEIEASFQLTNDDLVMSREFDRMAVLDSMDNQKRKVAAQKKAYSKGYAAKKGYTFWEKDFDAMAFKTMLRQLISKWGIMSIDLQTAFEQDVMQESEEYVESAEISAPPAIEEPEAEPEEVQTAEHPGEEEQVSLNDL